MKSNNPLLEQVLNLSAKIVLSARKHNTVIMINSTPKSASSFLSNIFSKLLNCRHRDLVYAYEYNYHQLYFPKVAGNHGKKYVVHQHTPMTLYAIDIMIKYKIYPVIHTRNIFDTVISLCDHLEHSTIPKIFTSYTNECFFYFPREKKLDYVISCSLPWYFSFYAGWYDTWKRNTIPIFWSKYEDLIDNKIETVQSILAFYKLKMTDQKIEQAVKDTATMKNRFNVGIKGRGDQELTVKQKNKIKSYCKYYPKVDFHFFDL